MDSYDDEDVNGSDEEDESDYQGTIKTKQKGLNKRKKVEEKIGKFY